MILKSYRKNLKGLIIWLTNIFYGFEWESGFIPYEKSYRYISRHRSKVLVNIRERDREEENVINICL